MSKLHHEQDNSAAREKTQNKIDRITRRTKLAPYIATFGIAGAALYGASDNSHETFTTISLASGVVAAAGLITERKYTERQVEKSVKAYMDEQESSSRYSKTELTISDDGKLVESNHMDRIALGSEYRMERSAIGGSMMSSVSAPLTGYFFGRAISGEALPGSEGIVGGIGASLAVMGVVGLSTAHRSATKLHESAIAQLDNIDGGISFTNKSE